MKLIALLAIAMPVAAEQSYSPYVDRNYPENVYWGDTHLHTYLSGDAYSLGTTITPDQAYRFAKGDYHRPPLCQGRPPVATTSECVDPSTS